MEAVWGEKLQWPRLCKRTGTGTEPTMSRPTQGSVGGKTEKKKIGLKASEGGEFTKGIVLL